VIIDYDIQFLDMTSPITTYTWEVRNLTSGETLDIEDIGPFMVLLRRPTPFS